MYQLIQFIMLKRHQQAHMKTHLNTISQSLMRLKVQYDLNVVVRLVSSPPRRVTTQWPGRVQSIELCKSRILTLAD